MNYSEQLTAIADKERKVYITGFHAGCSEGAKIGIEQAKREGYDTGYWEGYDIGYGEGLSDGLVGGKMLGYDEAEAITKALIDRTIAGDYVIPEGVTEIGVAAFQYCRQLTSVKIPESVVKLNANAFGETYLTELVLPMNCSVLNSYALSTMRELITLKLGNVTEIANNVFTNNDKCTLYDFSKCSQVPTLRNVNAFSSINAEAKIIVPAELYDEWIVATNWSQFADYIEPTSSEITFYIDLDNNGEYYPFIATKGMTWGEWVDSYYNTHFITNGNSDGENVGTIYYIVSAVSLYGNRVSDTDEIYENCQYQVY